MRVDFFVTFFLAAFLCGCTLYLPEAVKSTVSEKGAHATRVVRTPIGIYFTSISFVPGSSIHRTTPLQDSVACHNNTTAARVFYTAASTRHTAKLACEAILDTITYVSRFGNLSQDFEYQAVLVPDGEAREAKSISFYPLSKMKPRFLIFDAPRMAHAIVGLFAHEYIHMLLGLTQKHYDVTAREEAAAYVAELCAQMNVLGSISLDDLPGGPIATDGSDAVTRSSKQGYAIRQQVYPYLSNGALHAKSRSGDIFMNKCNNRLQDFFKDFKSEM